MNDTNLIDNCQARLPVQYARTSNAFTRSDTGVVIDCEPNMSRSFLFASLAVRAVYTEPWII